MPDAKPIILVERGSDEPLAAMCGVCKRHLWMLSSFGGGPGALAAAMLAAVECCAPKVCKTCGSPMQPWGCPVCRAKADRDRLAKDFAKAKKVPLDEYDGGMVTDGEEGFEHATDWDDECFSPLELEDGTRFLWGTRPEKASVDLERECADDWLQEHHEDAFDSVDLKKLAKAQKLVNEALAPVTTYYEDRSVAVVVPTRSDDAQETPQCICPFGVLVGDCPVHGELVPDV